MSAAFSLKMPFSPTYDAIASMRRNIRSKIGPDVSMLIWEAAVFTAILAIGLVYVLKKGVLEWQKAE